MYYSLANYFENEFSHKIVKEFGDRFQVLEAVDLADLHGIVARAYVQGYGGNAKSSQPTLDMHTAAKYMVERGTLVLSITEPVSRGIEVLNGFPRHDAVELLRAISDAQKIN